jgi:hypothetical protein
MIKEYIYFLKNKFLKDSTLLEGYTIITTRLPCNRSIASSKATYMCVEWIFLP